MAARQDRRYNPGSELTSSIIVGAALGLGLLAWRQFGGQGQSGGQQLPYPQYPRLINLLQWGGSGFAWDQVTKRVVTINEGADAGPANNIQEAIARVHAWFGR